ncbi:MAG: DUF3899 domain-containing protein [Clostridia bacterium]|nr:DUF3899 domain-containing protein [Clostridia bacterium]
MKLINLIFGDFRSIKWRTLAIAVPVTLLYPLARGIFSGGGLYSKLLFISDSLFIMSMILLLIGVVFTFIIAGDLDITKYVYSRSAQSKTKSFAEYKKDREAERGKMFNYPLFLGLIYLIISVIIGFII